ncbi:MAG: NifU family protein [Tessaracoccus sp.]|uniref:NifU family protein n=1 Tax=Tessaracoccus sp. TaxID=1971211 RepID=UPI001ED3AEDD|nr:NifU family protein [Tessaracoccus sp.]MBK7822074.1 NifU family protein [Tessaracoccus sp.]
MRRSIHPQAGPDEAVRWVTDVALPVGRVVAAPGTLGPLLDYDVLTRVFVEPGGVWTWLAPGLSWTDHGPRIRDAVSAAVDLDGWRIDEDDDLLALIARDVVDGELAGYISSHGGVITVESAADGVLTLDFGGACTDCPAAGSTLHDRIESAVRERYPALVAVQQRPRQASRPHGWIGVLQRHVP